MITLFKPPIKNEDIANVTNCLQSGWIGNGKIVKEFESTFKEYIETDKACISANSCTAALHLALLSAGILPKDEVITTPMSFMASTNVIRYIGAIPVFIDIDPITLNLDSSQIEKNITKKTKAILIVHYRGLPCKMDDILTICQNHNLTLIEDCAHALEAKYQKKHVGLFGDYGCFSFQSTKTLTCGEGGMIVCNKKHESKIRDLSYYGFMGGRPTSGVFRGVGYKYYMTDINAALGLSQFKRIDSYHKRRCEIAGKYDDFFGVLWPNNVVHAFYLYNIMVANRSDFISYMTKNNIQVGIQYPSITDLLGIKGCPIADEYGRKTVSLPIHPFLSDSDINHILTTIHHWRKRK